MKWLSRFLIFLLIVIVGISIGLSIYYFMRNNEVFSIGTGEQSVTQYVNEGETFDIAVTRTNGSSDEYSMQSMNEEIVEFVESFDDDNSGNVKIWRFRAISGGNTTIQLITTNEAYKNLNVAVYVGNGSVENPFYIRSYQDLEDFANSEKGMTLTAHYQQVADIDMSVANKAWSPIGTGVTAGFTGTYNGNGHVISNLTLLKEGSSYATPDTVYTDASVMEAGLFARLGTGSEVSRLTISNATIDGNYSYAGALAGVSNGRINFVNVVDSVISSTSENTPTVGGVVGSLVGTDYGARVQYSGVANSTIAVANAGEIGGIAGEAEGAVIANSYAIVSISTESANNPVIGGIVGVLSNPEATAGTQTRNAVVNSYSVFNSLDIPNTNNSRIGGIVGWNSNNRANSQAVLRPEITEGENDELKNYNRILGNFYQKTSVNNFEINGLGGFEDVMDAYLAYPQTAENLKRKPTQEQLDNITNSGNVDSTIAFIGYDIQGKFAMWNFDLVWTIDATQNNGYPYIKSNAVAIADSIYDEFDVIYISNAQALVNAINEDKADGVLDGSYTIDYDIDLSEIGEWTPIGDRDMPFNGTFIMVAKADGNMPVIRNLVIYTDREFNGFFGVTGANANIQNLAIEGVRIEAGTYVGAIAGLNGGSITNSSVISNGTTEAVGIDVPVKNANQYLGGIAGYNDRNAIISNSTVAIKIIISGNANTHEINLGGIAGYSGSNATITGCTYNSALINNNYTYFITADIDSVGAEIVAGGIVGSLYSTVSGSTSTARINAPAVSGVIVGGIVGKYQTSTVTSMSLITANKAENIYLVGYLVGGIIGKLDSSSANGVTNVVAQSYSTGSIYGTRVGGLAGEITRGGIVNCYTTCYLSGSVMGGFAADILFANTSDYGRVSYCFSNATFDKSAGNAYAETSSEVRALNNWWNADTKVGGYVEHCIYNSDSANGAERRYDSFRFLWLHTNPDDGMTSDANCKRMETFTNRGFDSTIWNFVSDSYPTLNI